MRLASDEIVRLVWLLVVVGPDALAMRSSLMLSDLGQILWALVVLILTVYSCPRYLLLLSYKVDKTM